MAKFISNKKGICSCARTGHQLVTFLATKLIESCKRGSKKIILLPDIIRFTRLHNRYRGRELRIIFDNYHFWRADEILPNPQIISIKRAFQSATVDARLRA